MSRRLSLSFAVAVLLVASFCFLQCKWSSRRDSAEAFQPIPVASGDTKRCEQAARALSEIVEWMGSPSVRADASLGARSVCAPRLRSFIDEFSDTPSGLTARIYLADTIGDPRYDGESRRLLECVEHTTWGEWHTLLARWVWIVIRSRVTGTDNAGKFADELLKTRSELARLDEVDSAEFWTYLSHSRPPWDSEGRRPMKGRFSAIVLMQVAAWYKMADDMQDPVTRLRGDRSPRERLARSLEYWHAVARDFPDTPESREACLELASEERAAVIWSDWHGWVVTHGLAVESMSKEELLQVRNRWRADARGRGVPGVQ